ncbi:MAG: FkbM family methyltransferase [Bacteroidia bacterium]|nr:FkbM family methyltransferase [Bacteroidia bacterium]MDW8417046.1 FkbM family methyltransferase [Bacteroidia bacterium]
MVREWLTIRGERWIDTLMLWINGLFWLPRRWYAQRSGPPNTAWHKLMQNPSRHWSRWPFSLQGRFFRWQGHLITDALGLTWFLGRQHQDMPSVWLSRIATGQIGIDIGAHRGYWSLFYRFQMPMSARVILLEPDPENYAYLLQNLAANHADWGIALPVAAWKAPARLSLRRLAMNSVHDSFGGKVEASETWDTLATSIDSIVEALALPTVDWIKIDVEGAELEVLEGAAETLRRFSPTLWIEIHDTWEPVKGILTRFAYEVKDSIEKEGTETYSRIGYIWAERCANNA